MNGALKGLYKRGNVWWYRWGAKGIGYAQSLKTSDEDEAIKRALEIKSTPELRTADEWKKEVAAFVLAKEKRGEFRGQSGPGRKKVLLKVGPAMNVNSPEAMTTEGIQKWYDGLAVQATTKAGYLSYLSSFCEWLIESKKIRKNPCASVKRGKVRKKGRKSFIEAEDVDKLIDGVTARVMERHGGEGTGWGRMGLTNTELKFILLCGFDAGLRTEEIIEARPEWFDLKRGLLHLQHTATWIPKDNDARTIPLTKRFAAFLEEYGLPEPYMIKPKVKKAAWRYRYDFRRPFNDYTASMGFPDLTRHDMRRTFASLRVSSGVSIYKVARWLGDGVTVVERHYGHLIPLDADIERDR